MRVSDIIRNILDVIDQAESGETIAHLPQDENGGAYRDSDVKRFKQIVDLVQDTPYSTVPQETYASIDAVTGDAGADGWMGTKEPEDIRGTTFRIYPSEDR